MYVTAAIHVHMHVHVHESLVGLTHIGEDNPFPAQEDLSQSSKSRATWVPNLES